MPKKEKTHQEMLEELRNGPQWPVTIPHNRHSMKHVDEDGVPIPGKEVVVILAEINDIRFTGIRGTTMDVPMEVARIAFDAETEPMHPERVTGPRPPEKWVKVEAGNPAPRLAMHTDPALVKRDSGDVRRALGD